MITATDIFYAHLREAFVFGDRHEQILIFLKEYYVMIHRAAGWNALRWFLLVRQSLVAAYFRTSSIFTVFHCRHSSRTGSSLSRKCLKQWYTTKSLSACRTGTWTKSRREQKVARLGLSDMDIFRYRFRCNITCIIQFRASDTLCYLHCTSTLSMNLRVYEASYLSTHSSLHHNVDISNTHSNIQR